MTGIVHATVATGTDAGTGDIHKAEWNAEHSRPFPLDRYAIDGTYGDDFTAGSLSGSWTRRNFTSGDETYQVGVDATFLRIATSSRSAGDGYFRTAPAGDWTFGMKHVMRGANVGLGLCVVDTNGTGVGIVPAYTGGSPLATILVAITTYTTYGGSYVQPDIPGSSPNASNWGVTPIYKMLWTSIRKSSTSYFVSLSADGEAWGVESAALTWAGTVDRVGMMIVPLGTNGSANATVDVDWLNKIA